MCEKKKKKKEESYAWSDTLTNGALMIAFLNCINDESHDCCVAWSQRWSTILGTRETAWHDEFVTGLGHATCFRLLVPSFFPRTPSWLRAPFLTSTTHRVSTCDKFLKYSPAFYCPREKYYKSRLVRETVRLVQILLSTMWGNFSSDSTVSF